MKLAVWSGPRNLSTALMRSWETRSDTTVLDEPLYAYYLTETGLDHPGRDLILRAGPRSADAAIAACLAVSPAPVQYQKHMTHHLLPHMRSDWVNQMSNVLLIRHPARVLASYVKVRQTPTLDDIGVPQQLRLRQELTDVGGPPPIIDADDFLADPEGFLRALCDFAGVAFEAEMLHWPPGPRESDGVWAPHWYASVEASTGFGPTPASPPPAESTFPPDVQHILRTATPLYLDLHQHRLRL